MSSRKSEVRDAAMAAHTKLLDLAASIARGGGEQTEDSPAVLLLECAHAFFDLIVQERANDPRYEGSDNTTLDLLVQIWRKTNRCENR
jgi:hypothetical protein